MQPRLRQDSFNSDRRTRLKKIADDTLAAIENGSYTVNGQTYDLEQPTKTSKQQTAYYAPDSLLSAWPNSNRATSSSSDGSTNFSILEATTLEGMRLLRAALTPDDPNEAVPRIGVLNFASAKKPGGGFLKGAQAQEESIARSSTLYPTLMTRTSQEFYTLHNRDPKGGYYSHAMIYSPGVTVFRDDHGGWVEPFQVDVLTSPAVNAGVVRETLHGRVAGDSVEGKIAQVMRERMARILYLYETKGVKNLVLGSFGTGVFRNDVTTIATIWADLLMGDNARFKDSFDHVVFSILGKETYETFRTVFESRGLVDP
ncbi:hypothetical protein PYCCODRAFT_1454428 [Trametes coccinea BRFM310]|uniref:Microbial-type PARG catalytic domain-containing protein n=1 Tax=Trametes coccinea (strain BRFM310) TaxID=1353009 RepID=A0A1Y2IBH7_TRAC3|nr:hypothetical protein PYCCODRAFT_1454428 [Trametes coccinea BRFM310]